jgi:hypothetical protein
MCDKTLDWHACQSGVLQPEGDFIRNAYPCNRPARVSNSSAGSTVWAAAQAEQLADHHQACHGIAISPTLRSDVPDAYQIRWRPTSVSVTSHVPARCQWCAEILQVKIHLAGYAGRGGQRRRQDSRRW